jgi:hypothetical protein
MHVFVTGGSGLTGPAVVSSARTQTLLGWTPTHATLLEDIEAGDYCAPQTV